MDMMSHIKGNKPDEMMYYSHVSKNSARGKLFFFAYFRQKKYIKGEDQRVHIIGANIILGAYLLATVTKFWHVCFW